MLHKPVSVVSTVKDPEGRKTVLDFLPPAYKTRRIYPVGRLDFFSEGLLLLTDDGELANRLMHPRWHMPRVYHVKVRLPDKGYDLQKTVNLMEKGMKLAEGKSSPLCGSIFSKRRKANRKNVNSGLNLLCPKV